MERKYNRYPEMAAVVVIICLSAGIVSAATVTQSTTYQGKLTDAAGNPLTGTYTVRFSLWDAAIGGTELIQNYQTVTATNGLFTTPCFFPQYRFDGSALWLGVKVGSDPEMAPRQEIRPVPFALTLRPGAFITGTGTSPALNLQNNGGGTALNLSAKADESTGVSLSMQGDHSTGILEYSNGIGSEGVRITMRGGNTEGVRVDTAGDWSRGVNSTVIGEFSPAMFARTVGDHSHGLDIETEGEYGMGVRSTTTGDSSYGLFSITEGYLSHGVRSQTTGPYSHAVSVRTDGYAAAGVDAETYGKYGYAFSGITRNVSSSAMLMSTYNENSTVARLYAYDDNSGGIEVHTYGSVDSRGIAVNTAGGNSDGVYAHTLGTSSYGVWADSSQSIGVYSNTGRADHQWGFYTPDYLYAGGAQVPSGDVAEYMPVAGAAEPGTVLIIGEDSRLEPSSSAYDSRVAGIVSTEPGIFLGTKESGNHGETLIAIAGRVPCRVDATKAAIHAGDLLTTSDNPGHAMKAEPDIVNGHTYYPDGTILGKAMGSLDSGTGVIDVLVTLQ